MHTQTQIRPLHVAGGDVLRVGPSVTNLGYNLHDSWWGVPRFAVVLPDVPVQLDKLRKVRLSREHVLDTPPVKVKTVCGELEPSIGNSAFHVRKKMVRSLSGSLADNARQNELALRFESDKRPLVAEFGRIANAHLPLFLTDKAPYFIGLNVADAHVANKRIQLRFRSLRCRIHQRKDRALVQSSQPGDGPHAHSLKHHRKSFCGSLRIGVMGSEFGFILGERDFAGSAAIPLNVAFAVGSKPARSVVTTSACHGLFPLAFCWRKAQNQFDGLEIGLPDFCLAPTSVDAEAGALH